MITGGLLDFLDRIMGKNVGHASYNRATDSNEAIREALDIIDTNVDDIELDTGTTLPATLGTPIDTNLATDIANVQTVVDALNALGAAEFESFYGTTVSTGFVTAINISGSGKVYHISADGQDAGETWTLKITIDGYACEVSSTGNAAKVIQFQGAALSGNNQIFEALAAAITLNNTLRIDFKSQFKVEYKTSNASATAELRVDYGVH